MCDKPRSKEGETSRNLRGPGRPGKPSEPISGVFTGASGGHVGREACLA